MIRTQPIEAEGKVEVAFMLPEVQDGQLCVVGDFNDWDPTVTPMTPCGAGYEATVTVDAGRRYAFRYLRADGAWFNDEAAHTYEPGPFGSDNSVIDVTDIIDLRATAPATAAKKPRARKAKA